MSQERSLTLQEWLERRGSKPQWIAQRLGISPGVVSRWLSGKTVPSLKHANAIHRLTNGEVTSLDWEEEAPTSVEPIDQAERDEYLKASLDRLDAELRNVRRLLNKK